MIHIPVMLEESLRFLITDNNASYLDATFGRGGHSSAILDSLSETGCLTSFDKDPEAHDHATRTFQDNRFTFMPKGFEDLDQLENISIFQGLGLYYLPLFQLKLQGQYIYFLFLHSQILYVAELFLR